MKFSNHFMLIHLPDLTRQFEHLLLIVNEIQVLKDASILLRVLYRFHGFNKTGRIVCWTRTICRRCSWSPLIARTSSRLLCDRLLCLLFFVSSGVSILVRVALVAGTERVAPVVDQLVRTVAWCVDKRAVVVERLTELTWGRHCVRVHSLRFRQWRLFQLIAKLQISCCFRGCCCCSCRWTACCCRWYSHGSILIVTLLPLALRCFQYRM